MDIQQVIADLEAERDRLEAAIAALRSSQRRGGKLGRRRGPMSAEAKRKISQAQKKAWAARKRAAKAS